MESQLLDTYLLSSADDDLNIILQMFANGKPLPREKGTKFLPGHQEAVFRWRHPSPRSVHRQDIISRKHRDTNRRE